VKIDTSSRTRKPRLPSMPNRARGVPACGFGAIVNDAGAHGAHSDDERLAETSIVKMAESSGVRCSRLQRSNRV
jgi:hypothetical protein